MLTGVAGDNDCRSPHTDRLLGRRDTAHALTEAGFPTTAATLATLASRGGGPPYRLYGKIAIYAWKEALDWAVARMSPPRQRASKVAGTMHAQREAAIELRPAQRPETSTMDSLHEHI